MVGQNIGKYRVLDRVGRGGMGTVYRAIDETLHREVAIKVLNAELSDPEVAKRFRAEAITVARLSHPGIATIYELFQHEGQWLMVMEFVRGETLEHMVERMGPISPQRSAELCMQVLAALAHAHSMGVVHRDLKPANMMVTESGAIKVMDFGIARVAGTEHLTNAGFMMGTPAYMAPEQVMGREIDARADIYALGVVFFRLTTSKLPFKGDTPFAMAQSQVNDPPTPVGMYREDLPVWVQQVVERALAKNPEERFQSAVEFHEGFARCLAGLPMTSTYNSSAPTEILMTPSRAMPTGAVRTITSATIPHVPTPPVAMPTAQARTTGTQPATTQKTPGVGPANTNATGASEMPTIAGPSPARDHTPAALRASAMPRTATLSQQTAALPSLGASTGQTGKFATQSRIGLITAAAIVVLLAGAGTWYFASKRNSVIPPATESVPPPTTPVETAPALAPLPGSESAVTPPAPGTTPPASGSSTPGAATTSGTTAPGATTGRATDPAAAGRAGSPTATAMTPGVAGRGPIDDTHQAFSDVKVLVVTGRKTRDEDALLSFVGGQISVLAKNNGSAIATVPYRNVVHATYVHARDPKWAPALPSPPQDLDVGSVLRTSKHWLVLQSKDSYLLLRLDDSNWNRVLQTVEARTGLAIDRPKGGDNK